MQMLVPPVKKPPTLYQQLKKRCLPHLEHFHDDLLKWDREWLKENPGIPFLHYTRKTGTHIFGLRPTSALPKRGERVPYLFGTANRDHIAKQPLECAKMFAEWKEQSIVLHFDGKVLREVSYEKAVEVARDYLTAIRKEWDDELRRF